MAESSYTTDDLEQLNLEVDPILKENLGCKILKENLPTLVKKILPDEICDQLFSKDLISEAVYTSMFDRSVLREYRAREMVTSVLQSVRKDESNFELFCSVLEKAKKPSISKLGTDMHEDFKSQFHYGKSSCIHF